ncbi:MAG: sel1 repeat family protein [Candidatus Paracaedimonas acanthamoebae]|uniref:Sel1 repeat family protein n=1 Tax=Candidatus Paracaedimonas acanthamoebae TaxID=244581 RepID=A0A8J7TUQ2_9PROT|nr:sel1 repeat family protein [Candidatus Paracaedimonas acanthamoebae]
MQKDIMLRPHVKDLILSSELPQKSKILKNIESPQFTESTELENVMNGIFGKNKWTPHVYPFENDILQELFKKYSPKTSASEKYMIFLANVLEVVGSKLYEQNKKYIEHLEHAASLGHARAQYKMFFIDFRMGKVAEAKNYLFSSAAQGYASALLKLSEVYQGVWDIGIDADQNIAKLLCKQASDLGDSEAKFRIEVSTLVDGLFKSEKNYQEGIRNAKALEEAENKPAKDFLDATRMSSGGALQEGNDFITNTDLEFLRTYLGWKDEGEEVSEEEGSI